MRSALPSAVRLLLALLLATLAVFPTVCAADEPRLKLVAIARGLEHPWAVAFLPDGRIVVTERPGRVRMIGKDGRLGEPLAGVPAVAASGQGGLLDVVIGPGFERDPWLYFSFSEPGEGGNGTAVARARLQGEAGHDHAAALRSDTAISSRRSTRSKREPSCSS